MLLTLTLTVLFAQSFSGPSGIACHTDGRVFVVDDHAHRIVVLDRSGREVRTIGRLGTRPGELSFPDAVSFGSDGLLYVADTGGNRIQVLREDGEFVREFGGSARPGWSRGPVPLMLFGFLALAGAAVLVLSSSGSRTLGLTLIVAGLIGLSVLTIVTLRFPMVLQNPRDVLVRADGSVWVADFGSNLVRVFKADGKLVASHDASASGVTFNRPLGLAADADRIFVSDSGNHRIVVLDNHGGFVRTIGTQGSAPGQLDTPHGLALGKDGRLFVTDRGNRRVQVFSADGTFANALPGDFTPAGICLTPDQRMLVVDIDNHRVLGW